MGVLGEKKNLEDPTVCSDLSLRLKLPSPFSHHTHIHTSARGHVDARCNISDSRFANRLRMIQQASPALSRGSPARSRLLASAPLRQLRLSLADRRREPFPRKHDGSRGKGCATLLYGYSCGEEKARESGPKAGGERSQEQPLAADSHRGIGKPFEECIIFLEVLPLPCFSSNTTSSEVRFPHRRPAELARRPCVCTGLLQRLHLPVDSHTRTRLLKPFDRSIK